MNVLTATHKKTPSLSLQRKSHTLLIDLHDTVLVIVVVVCFVCFAVPQAPSKKSSALVKSKVLLKRKNVILALVVSLPPAEHACPLLDERDLLRCLMCRNTR